MYDQQAAYVRKIIYDHDLQVEKSVISKDNLGTFYRFVNRKLSCRSGVGPLKTDSGDLILDDNRKAEALNNYFTSVLTVDDGVLPDFPRRVVENVLIDHVDFTVADVISTINHIKTSTTADPQGFTNAFLKRLKFSLAQPLSSVFPTSFHAERFQMIGARLMSLPSSRKVCLLM